MDKKLKAKWVKALRSGEFKQARQRYFDNDTNGYCCIGVLVCLRTKKSGIDISSGNSILDSERAIGNAAAVDKLISMNDFKKRSFKQIASWIEKYLPATR